MKHSETVRAVLRARTAADKEGTRLTGDDVVRIVMEAIAGDHEPPNAAAPDFVGHRISESTYAELVEAGRWESFCRGLQSTLAHQAGKKRKHTKPSQPVTVEQVARAAGVSVDEARDGIGHAIEQGTVETVGRGKGKRYQLAPAGLSMIGGLGAVGERELRVAKALKTLAEAGITVPDDEGGAL